MTELGRVRLPGFPSLVTAMGVDAAGAVAEAAASRCPHGQRFAAELAVPRFVQHGQVAVVCFAEPAEKPPGGRFAHALARGEGVHELGDFSGHLKSV
jgi:hypothetical protein